MLEAANITCGDYEHNESEWEASNLTPLPSVKARAALRRYCILLLHAHMLLAI
jgi:hypothetical protein